VFVKVCGLRTERDVDTAVERGKHALERGEAELARPSSPTH